MFCTTPEFFLFGSSIDGKRNVMLTADDFKVKLYLCRVSLNDNVYNESKEKPKANSQVAWHLVVRSMIRTSLSLEIPPSSRKMVCLWAESLIV